MRQMILRMFLRHSAVFGHDLGCLKDFKAQFLLKSDAKPRFCKPRPFALAKKETIERELNRLEADGVLEKVTHSDWAVPIVTPIKKQKKMVMRGCVVILK